VSVAGFKSEPVQISSNPHCFVDIARLVDSRGIAIKVMECAGNVRVNAAATLVSGSCFGATWVGFLMELIAIEWC